MYKYIFFAVRCRVHGKYCFWDIYGNLPTVDIMKIGNSPKRREPGTPKHEKSEKR